MSSFTPTILTIPTLDVVPLGKRRWFVIDDDTDNAIGGVKLVTTYNTWTDETVERDEYRWYSVVTDAKGTADSLNEAFGHLALNAAYAE